MSTLSLNVRLPETVQPSPRQAPPSPPPTGIRGVTAQIRHEYEKTQNELQQQVNKLRRTNPWVLRALQVLSIGSLAYCLPGCLPNDRPGLITRVTITVGTVMTIAQVSFYAGLLKLQFEALYGGAIDLYDPRRNLTQKAIEGRLPPMAGRENEIERLATILGCADKPNAVLIGLPGVGKTAIAEGLALRLANNNVSESLRGCTLIELRASEFMSGAGIVGAFEKRMEKFLEDVENAPNMILFIDEIHALTTLSTGSSNARDLLKPLLARGKCRLVGCTTVDESKMLFKDGAFARRFQPIDVLPPAGEELAQIVFARAQNYADHHRCGYSQDALRASIFYSDSIPGNQPDKSLSLLDRAGAAVSRTRGEENPIPQVEASDVIAQVEAITKRKITFGNSDLDDLYS